MIPVIILCFVVCAGSFRALGLGAVRYNTFCGPLAVPGTVKRRTRLKFLSDSLVVNDLPEVPVTFSDTGKTVTVAMNSKVSAYFWDVGILTSWLTWWSGSLVLSFDSDLGVLVFKQSDRISLVFSEDACGVPIIDPVVTSAVISYAPPLGSFCGKLSRKNRVETTIRLDGSSIQFDSDSAMVPFEMDGPIVVFDGTHASYVDFLAKGNFGYPVNHLFIHTKGRLHAAIGESQLFFRPCSLVNHPYGSFCYKLSMLTTFKVDFTLSDEMKFSLFTPLEETVFPRTVPFTVTDSVEYDEGSHAISDVTRSMKWKTFKIRGFSSASVSAEITPRKVIVLRRC